MRSPVSPESTQNGWQEETIEESPRSKPSISKPNPAQGSHTSTTSATDAAAAASPSFVPPAFAGSRKVAFVLSKHGAVASAAPKAVGGGSKRANQLFAAATAAKKGKVHIAGKVPAVLIGPVLPNGAFVKHTNGSPRPGAVPGPWKGSSASRTQYKPNTASSAKRPASNSWSSSKQGYGQQASSKSLAYSFTKVSSPQKKPGSYSVPSRPSNSNPLNNQPKLKKRRKSSGTMASANSKKLSQLLDQETVDDDHAGAAEAADEEIIDSLSAALNDVALGVCVECEEVAGDVYCDQCDDCYCNMCYSILHRKGNRAKHTCTQISTADKKKASALATSLGVPLAPAPSAAGLKKPTSELGVGSSLERLKGPWFAMRARYIPVRLTLKERKRLRLVVASLAVSDYTGRIDTPALQKGAKRQHQQLKEICANFTGVLVSTDAAVGKEVAVERDFGTYGPFLQNVYEYVRRHKIMNPEKLRTNYGKMVYMLQDAATEQAKALLEFSLTKDIKSVYGWLEENNILGVLHEPAMAEATMEILPEQKSRATIQHEIKKKELAQERISKKYCGGSSKTKETIKWCLYSISDNFSFLNSNRKPIDMMIVYLKEYFKPDKYEKGFSLTISSGVEGARLTHNHNRHYNYVLQSLTLWREIADDMFRLWSLAEQDLIADDNRYVLKDTGQGLQRVQAAPRVLSAMRTILHNCQHNLGEWIGSSVIHLGDSNVPNAMMFVDKYTQVARILSPIIQTIREIDTLVKEDGIKTYIKTSFGSGANLKRLILHDFFKNGFDGSGADNFFDAGSCIDGRLTSAWNWCSTLQEKPFYPIFLLAGFVGFDGQFQE